MPLHSLADFVSTPHRSRIAPAQAALLFFSDPEWQSSTLTRLGVICYTYTRIRGERLEVMLWGGGEGRYYYVEGFA